MTRMWVALLAGFLAVMTITLPQEAVAHTSLTAEPTKNLSTHSGDEEAHCHGAIECFVTFFFEAVVIRSTSDLSEDAHVIAKPKQYCGTSLNRDPPVPILFV